MPTETILVLKTTTDFHDNCQNKLKQYWVNTYISQSLTGRCRDNTEQNVKTKRTEV